MKINRTALPADYRLAESFDLKKDKQHTARVDALSFFLTALVFVAAVCWKGFELNDLAGLTQWLVALVVTIFGYLIYIFLHELVHFLTIYIFTGKEPKYVYRFPLYVAVDSRAFLTQWEYVAVMLAPSVLFGVLFLAAGFFLEGPWFWCVCFLQAGNVGGSTGDFCYATKAACSHYTLRVYDSGERKEFFLPERVIVASKRK